MERMIVRTCFFLVLIMSVLVMTLVISSWILYLTKIENAEKTDTLKKSLIKYRSLRLDTEKNEITVGRVTIHEHLQNEEYIFYGRDDNEDGEDDVLMLISNFGVDGYRCIGSCICLDDGRKSASSIISRSGLITLVAAASLLFAEKSAEKYFFEQCSTTTSTCTTETTSTFSSVDHCERIFEEYDEEDYNSLYGDEQNYQENHFDRIEDFGVSFWCEGHCLHSEVFMDMTESRYDMYGEDEDENERQMIREEGRLELEEECREIRVSSEIRVRSGETPARQFQEQVLGPFCLQNGREMNLMWSELYYDHIVDHEHHDEYFHEDPKEILREEFEDLDEFESSQCIASNPPDFLNPSIQCIIY